MQVKLTTKDIEEIVERLDQRCCTCKTLLSRHGQGTDLCPES